MKSGTIEIWMSPWGDQLVEYMWNMCGCCPESYIKTFVLHGGKRTKSFSTNESRKNFLKRLRAYGWQLLDRSYA
jgi:hypothetical protein